MKNVADYYNKTATGWSNDWLNEKLQSAVLQKYYDCFARVGTYEPKILDLGCGAGYDAKILNELGAKVVGIDLSEKLIDIAKTEVPKCKFFVGDINDPMTSLGKFDGIVCLATIIHIGILGMKNVFKNIADVMKKGALLIISCRDGAGKDYQKSQVEIEGDFYDQNINDYKIEELCAFAHPELKLVDSWKFGDFDEGWRYYIFMKK